MTFTPHPFGGPLTSAALNQRLTQLEQAIAAVEAAGLIEAATTIDAQALAGQAVVPVTSTVGFQVGDAVWIGTVGGGLQETRIVLSVQAGVSLTMTANLANTHNVGEPVSRSPSELVDARGTQATLGGRIGLIESQVVNVRRFGAKGDNVTDDTSAIQNALDSVAVGFSGSGHQVYFPPGSYRISAPLRVKSRGTRLVGAAGVYASVISPLGSFAQGGAPANYALIFKVSDVGLPYGVNVENLHVRLTDAPAGVGGIIHFHHDVASMTNVYVQDVPGNATAIRVQVNADLVTGGFTDVSETIVWTNVFARHRDATSVNLVRLDRVQEMTLVGCKFIANGGTAGRALFIDTPRSVTLIGCSTAGGALEHIRIENNHSGASTSVGYVNFFGHLWEDGSALAGARLLVAAGITARLIGVNVVAPRIMNANAATFQLADCDASDIDVFTIAVSLDANSSGNTIRCRAASQVTDLGTLNTVIAQDEGKITFAGAPMARRTLSGRQASGTIAAGGSADVVVNWLSGAFPNTNYTVVVGLNHSAAVAGTIVAHVLSRAVGSVTVRVKNNDAVGRDVTVHAIAVAD